MTNIVQYALRKTVWMPLALILAATVPLAACSSSGTSESTGEYVDDSAITAKVKTALLNDSGLKSFSIGVETYKGTVQLSGFVNSDALKSRAGSVTAGVAGVRSVRNNLVVK